MRKMRPELWACIDFWLRCIRTEGQRAIYRHAHADDRHRHRPWTSVQVEIQLNITHSDAGFADACIVGDFVFMLTRLLVGVLMIVRSAFGRRKLKAGRITSMAGSAVRVMPTAAHYHVRQEGGCGNEVQCCVHRKPSHGRVTLRIIAVTT